MAWRCAGFQSLAGGVSVARRPGGSAGQAALPHRSVSWLTAPRGPLEPQSQPMVSCESPAVLPAIAALRRWSGAPAGG